MSLRTLRTFFIATFVLSWGVGALFVGFPERAEALFGPMGYTNPAFIVIVYTPGIVALVLVVWHYGIRGLGRFLRRLTLWRMSATWWLLLVVGMPAVFYLGAAVKGTLSDPFPFAPWYAVLPGTDSGSAHRADRGAGLARHCPPVAAAPTRTAVGVPHPGRGHGGLAHPRVLPQRHQTERLGERAVLPRRRRDQRDPHRHVQRLPRQSAGGGHVPRPDERTGMAGRAAVGHVPVRRRRGSGRAGEPQGDAVPRRGRHRRPHRRRAGDRTPIAPQAQCPT